MLRAQLILPGANVEAKTLKGETALNFAPDKETKALHNSVSRIIPVKERPNLVNKIINKHDPKTILLRLEHLRSDYENPIHAAVRFGWSEELKKLVPYLEKKRIARALISERNFFGFTPIDIAMILGDEYALEMLSNLNVDVLAGINSLILAESFQSGYKKACVIKDTKKKYRKKISLKKMHQNLCFVFEYLTIKYSHAQRLIII